MKRSFLFGLIFLVCTIVTPAQGTRGTIRGTVTDPNGAVVPNATVQLFDSAQGTEIRTAQSDGNGNYQILEVEPSTYNLIIKASNFAELKIVSFKVEPNRNLTLDAKLSVGQVANEVTITAGEQLIDKESATLGTTVDNRRVIGLPLNGRNVLNLALLQPGVAPAGGGFGNGSGIRVNGSRGVENNLTLDGGNNNEVAVGGAIGATPRPDAVSEFRLLTSNFEPEFGRNTGAVINVVTKSGTNAIHGNGRLFYRPTVTSAALFLDKALPQGRAADSDFRRRFERKDYGFNVGGPIYLPRFGEGGPAIYKGKDRSFFFLDYERRAQLVGQSQTLPAVPTANERAGIFSTQIIDPATGAPFANNTIPVNRISPIAQYYLQFLPAPTVAGQSQVSANQPTTNNFLTIRLDHTISSKQFLNFTYNRFNSNVFSPFAFGGSNVPGFGSSDLDETQNYILRYTNVISSNLVNSLLLNYSANDQPGVAPVNTTTPADIGFTANFLANSTFAGPPSIRLLERGITLGNTIQGPQRRATTNRQIQDSLSWVVGSHRLKFGFDFTSYHQGQDFLFINQGIFTYSGNNGGNTTGDDFADFLLGSGPVAIQFGSAGRRDFRQTAQAYFAQDTWRAQKNLTITYGVRYEYNSPLTDLFNRVAYYRPGSTSPQLAAGTLRTLEGQNIILGGTRAPNGLAFVGDPDNVLGGTVPEGGVRPDRNNFAPRVGIAYSFGDRKGGLGKIFGNDQTVIKAGFGYFYGAIIGDTSLQQLTSPGYNGTNAFFFPASGTLANPFGSDPFPNFNGDQGQIANPFAATTLAIAPVLSQFSQPIDPNLKTPQVAQFNVTLERAFAKDYVFSIGYVGSRGHKLYIREAVNPSLGTFIPASSRPQPIGTLNTVQFGVIPNITTSNSNNRRLNDDIRLGLNQLTAGGNSQYDSLQANFQKRFSSDGLLFQASYTFSKSITDADTQRGQFDLLDRSAGRALSADDHPHRFVGSVIYEVPFFKQTNGIVNRLVDGWSIGGIYTYQSGDLITVGNPFDTVGTGGAIFSFADLGSSQFQALNGVAADRRGFNANSFASFRCDVALTNATTGGTIAGVLGTPTNACPTGFRRGTSGINQSRLDNPINNIDAIVTKHIKAFSERNNLELRFEAFNLLNKTQFTTINTNLNNVFRNADGTINETDQRTTFGRYTNTRDARSIQFGIRLNF